MYYLHLIDLMIIVYIFEPVNNKWNMFVCTHVLEKFIQFSSFKCRSTKFCFFNMILRNQLFSSIHLTIVIEVRHNFFYS
jgi:hypothetical protein